MSEIFGTGRVGSLEGGLSASRGAQKSIPDDEWSAILAETKTRSREASSILDDILASPDRRAVFQSGDQKISISKSLPAKFTVSCP